MSSTQVLVVGDGTCVGCLRWKLAVMHAAARVRLSKQIGAGDLVILNGKAEPLIFLGVCGRCILTGIDDGFDGLLERIRKREHPAFGELRWNGRSRQITETVLFEKEGGEADEVVRRRALAYLEGLTEEERAAADIDIVFRERRPVRAVLRAQTSDLPSERLKQLRAGAGLKD